CESAAFHEFHAEKRPPVLRAHFVNRNDVRMIEPGCSLRFGLETFHLAFTSELAGEHQLQSDDTVEGQVAGAVDDAHATVSNLLKQFVAPHSSQEVLRLHFPGTTRVRAPTRLKERGLQQATRAHSTRGTAHGRAASGANLVKVSRHLC